MQKWWIIAAIVLVVAIGGFAYMNSTGGQNPQPTEQNNTVDTTESNNVDQADTQTEESTSTAESESVKEITVEGSGFKFNPKEIKVTQGDKVRITFKNLGGTHDFVIDEFNVATKVINGGQEETVEFTADKKGTFEYYCSVPGHKQAGMVGNLVVE